jgi:hypothetical protein
VTAESIALGTAFASGLAAKDYDALERILAADLDFRALTPNMAWEQHSAKAFIAEVLTEWFDEHDHIEELRSVQVRPVAGARSHLSYVVIVRNDDGQHVVEHQAYFEAANGEITWLRIMCAGYIPV